MAFTAVARDGGGGEALSELAAGSVTGAGGGVEEGLVAPRTPKWFHAVTSFQVVLQGR